MLSTPFRSYGLFIAISALSLVHASGQDYIYATGKPTFSTTIPVQNGFIDINNGNLHLEFTVSARPQRGKLTLNERLVYDSRIWKVVQSGGSYWQPTNVPNSAAGWRFTTGLETGTVGNVPTDYSYDTGETCQIGHRYMFDVTETWTTYSQFTWTDPQGTVHMFPIDTSQPTFVCNGDTSHTTASGSGYALDGSGYYAQVTQYYNMTVYDTLGNEVYPQIQDTNGNYFSSDVNGNLVDTSGNAPVLVSSSGNLTYFDVLSTGGTRQRYTATYSTISYSTSFGLTGVAEASGQISAITSLLLPDGTSYSFAYDSYGELQSITLPSGGTETFGYTNVADGYGNVNRWVSSRVKDGGTTSISIVPNGYCSPTSSCQADVTVTSPAGDDTLYIENVDAGDVANNSSLTQTIFRFKGNQNQSGIQLARESNTYTFATQSAADGSQYQTLTQLATTTTLVDAGQISQTNTSLVNGFLPGTAQTYDYYSWNGPAPQTPTTSTTYTYGYSVNGAALTTSVITTDGAGHPMSQLTYGYDGASVVPTSGLPNHNAVSGIRGNLTSAQQWLNTNNTTLQSSYAYDDAGSVISSTTPLGTTTITHDSTDTFPYLTTPPTPPSGVSLAVTTSYDQNSGVLLSATDPNGSVTNYQNFDVFGRPQQITYPDTGVENFSYTPTSMTDVRDFDSHTVRSSVQNVLDVYGRSSRTLVSTGSRTYRSDTCYDSSGRLQFTSIPYIDQGQGNVCSSMGTSYQYDALGRPTQVTGPDGAITTYVYEGRAIEVTANGVSRIIQSNVFGQPTIVCEVSNSTLHGEQPTSCGTDILANGFITTYTYDLANHKTTVTQGAQTRVFQTDSLGRTTYMSEPEAGITAYSYTYNTTGLQITRTRPAANQVFVVNQPIPQTTTITQYDNQGRRISVTYSDGTNKKVFSYDAYPGIGGLGSSYGKLILANTQDYSGNIVDQLLLWYDSMGRVSQTSECLVGMCTTGLLANRTYSYNYASLLKQENYATSLGATPNVAINYGYNIAGQLLSVSGGQNNSTLSPAIWSATTSSLTPFGAIVGQFGNGLYNVATFDGAGRVATNSVCSGSQTAGCTGGTVIYSFQDTVQGTQLTHSGDTVLGQQRDYTYDDFGRLSSLSTTPSTGATIGMSFDYDRYGNRWQQAFTAGSGPQPSFSFNLSNNQPSGYIYDVAGNVINDGVHSYTYDAENNLVTIDNGTIASYAFNALNQRVLETTASGTLRNSFNINGLRATQWQDGTNNLLQVQYYASSQRLAYWSSTDSNIHFEHRDWIGTERIRTSYNGSTESTFSSLPFGDGTGSSGSDTNEGHFATLDQNQASTMNISHAPYRDYHSLSGRWMSPDWYIGSYDMANPQSLNRYTYVLNNPLRYNDHMGLVLCDWGSNDQGGEDFDDDPDCAKDGGTVISDVQVVNVGGNDNDGYVSLLVFPTSISLVEVIAGSKDDPNTMKNKLMTCIKDFYNSIPGQAVKFGSPLSLLPVWNPEWGDNLQEWGVAVVGKLGGMFGAGVTPGTNELTTLRGTTTVGSQPELWAETGLGTIEKVAGPAMAVSTIVDIVAHGTCAIAASDDPSAVDAAFQQSIH